MSSHPAVKSLIFGPTGAVGLSCALEAHRLGAHLTLAMRDTSKPLPSLPSSLPRIAADLTSSSSLTATVKPTGCTTAFIYTHDDMLPTFRALAAGGIKHIVLLSSATIYPLSVEEAAQTSHAIPRKHALAELAAREAGLEVTAVRALYFASNVAYQRDEIVQTGVVSVLNPDGVWDYIAPEDIGTVCGAKIVEGWKANEKDARGETEGVVIVGPELIPARRGWRIVAKGIGREIEVREVSYQQFLEGKEGNEMLKSLAIGSVRSDQEKYPEKLVQQGRENMGRYLGREPMRFEEWVGKHIKDFD